MSIEIIINIDIENREVYTFTGFDTNFVLSRYSVQNKVKPKRNWTVLKVWDRLYSRESNTIEPILTDEIRELALLEAQKQIKVQTWKEYKKL